MAAHANPFARILTVTYGQVSPSSPRLDQQPPKLVDSPERTPNLWLFTLDGKGRQITRFVGGSVRWPAVSARTGDIAFEYGPDLWLLKAGEKHGIEKTGEKLRALMPWMPKRSIKGVQPSPIVIGATSGPKGRARR